MLDTFDPLPDIRWLIEHADAELGGDIPTDPLQLATRFRTRHGTRRSRLLCELYELRRRARTKFALADKMFLSRVGYEQATSEVVAAYKAERFPKQSAVVDLCCGVGGDAMSLGRLSRILTVIDRSEAMVQLCLANLRVHGISDVQGVAADVRSVDLSRYDSWHVDPDRRLGGRKHSTPNACEPPLDEFLQLPGLGVDGAVKLSPAADASELLAKGVELEWIGHRRECQQQVAWFGKLARHPGKRTATWLSRGQQISATTLVEDRGCDVPISVSADTPKFVYEPRPSVLAAGLEETLARQFGLQRLAVGVPYLASDHSVASGLFRRFEAIEIIRYRRKSLVERLAQLGLRVTEVKQRGVKISPDQLLRDLSDVGVGDPAVVILFPVKKSVHAILARRSD